MSIHGHAVHAWVPYAGGALAAGMLLALAYLLGRCARRKPAGKVVGERTSRGDLLAAAIATAVSAEGMWETFGALGMPIWLRAVTFAFVEIMTVQCARRARKSMRENYSAGADGIAMWVLTGISAALSVSHEVTAANTNGAVVLVRLVAPLVAAWGWERQMRLERRRRARGTSIHWRITPERIAVRLGLAEASERTTPQVDARRRIARVAQAVKALAVLEAASAKPRRVTRAQRKLNRLMQEANEHAGLARDPELQGELKAEIGSLLGVSDLAHLSIPAWWDEKPPGPALTEEEHETLAEVPSASDRLMRAVQAYRDSAWHGVSPTRRDVPTSTTSTGAPTTPARVPLAVVDDGSARARANQRADRDNQHDHAGHGPLPDLATIVRTATDLGWSERKIEKEYGITRYKVRTILGRPTSTSGDEGAA